MSGWEIFALLILLLLALAVGIAVLLAGSSETSSRQATQNPTGRFLEAPPQPPRRVPPASEPPLIVFRQSPNGSVRSPQISFRPEPTHIVVVPEQRRSDNGGGMVPREVKVDLDALCKLTCKTVRDCRCAKCKEAKASLGN
jgi:hypothetical protein